VEIASVRLPAIAPVAEIQMPAIAPAMENQLPASVVEPVIEMPATAENQMPAVKCPPMPPLQTNDLDQMPANAPANARNQMPANAPVVEDEMPATFAGELESDWIMPADDLWSELWRLEKDGRGGFRYVLRFVTPKLWRNGGPITGDVAVKLESRPGKGRHQQSRDEKRRLVGQAQHLAAQYRGGS
jgi:hypothetical protein